MVSSAVRKLGHAVVQAEDGDEGWQRFQAGRPEVVITDWAMPGFDGTELDRADPRRSRAAATRTSWS